jgi:hypothetical protein
MKKAGAKVDLTEKYIIQYSGIILDKKKLIECGIYKLEALRKNRGLLDFEEMMVAILTRPYDETDSDDWFDAFYDPSTDRLSETLGAVYDEPAAKSQSKAAADRPPTKSQKKATRGTEKPVIP